MEEKKNKGCLRIERERETKLAGYITWGSGGIKPRGRSIITLSLSHTQDTVMQAGLFTQKPNQIYTLFILSSLWYLTSNKKLKVTFPISLCSFLTKDHRKTREASTHAYGERDNFMLLCFIDEEVMFTRCSTIQDAH